jgi:hypothetical protein
LQSRVQTEPGHVVARGKIQDILEWTEEMRSLLHLLQTVREFRSTPYLGNSGILDIGID